MTDQSRPPEDPAQGAETRAEVPVEGGAQPSPYRNLFVPLVVVPAMIVFVLVLVFVLFGQIAGEEKSMAENLQRVQFAGANERDQALFHLVQQVEENWMAMQAGEELPWQMEGDVRVELERVWDETPPGDLHFRYVLAAALTQLDAESGLEKLIVCLETEPSADSGGTVRFNALVGLGVAGGELGAADRARAVEAMLPFLSDEDLGLQLAAAGALQNLPGAATREALRGLLSDGSIELRGQAAVSLSHLGDEAGAEVLWELIDLDTYDRARLENPEKFQREAMVAAVRERAVAALARLGRPRDLQRLREMAESDPDLAVREAAMRALAEAPEN